MSLHTFDNVQVNGNFRNSNGDTLDLSNLVHQSDLSGYAQSSELSNYALSADVSSQISTALADYQTVAGLNTAVDAEVSSQLSSYPSAENLHGVADRFIVRNGESTDASPIDLYKENVIGLNTGIHVFEITVMGKPKGSDIGAYDVFVGKMTAVVDRQSNSLINYHVLNGEQTIYRGGSATNWSFTAGLDGSYFCVNPTGEAGKNIAWSLRMTHDILDATA